MKHKKISIEEAQIVYNSIKDNITICGRDLPELDLKAVFGPGNITIKKVQEYVKKAVKSL